MIVDSGPSRLRDDARGESHVKTDILRSVYPMSIPTKYL
jgi:hypothetical protein